MSDERALVAADDLAIAADRVIDAMNEFPDYPNAWGEYLGHLQTALTNYEKLRERKVPNATRI